MSEKAAEASDSSSKSQHGSPPKRQNTVPTLEHPMTSDYRSWSSISQKIGRNIKAPVNSLRKRAKVRPEHPAIPNHQPSDQEEDEGDQPRGIAAECQIEDILQSDALETESRLSCPQFDAIGPYCVSDDEHHCQKIWYDEATWLHQYVKDPNVPVRFINEKYFVNGDDAGYKALSTMAEKILTAMSLCVLDNECINVRYCKRLSNRSKLQKLIQQAQVAAQAGHDPAENDTVPNTPEHDDFNLLERLRKEKELSEKDAMYELIDYITVVLARLITQTGTGRYWQSTVLCALVKTVAKIKVLLVNLPVNAQIAAENGEAVLDQSRDTSSIMATIIDEEEECEEALRIIAADTKNGLTSVDEAQVASYCVDQNKFRTGVTSALRSILMSLRCLNRSGLPTTAYEICSLVYETGFQGFKTLLFQDRDLEYCATSDLDNLNTANSAFWLLEKTVTHLKDIRTDESQSKPPSATLRASPTIILANIEWKYQVADNDNHEVLQNQNETQPHSLSLERMDDIITIMVPLATTNPCFVSELNSFRSVMLLTSDNHELVRPYRETNFAAFFRLYTNTFQDNTGSHGVLRLKTAFDGGTFERCRLIDSSNSSNNDSSSLSKKANSEFDERVHVMENEWVIDENSIIVPCPTYVLSMAAVAFVLAAGGIAIGFTVGDRIQGVDPFGIASYAWILAAFVILIGKSVLVRDWSWSNFLHLRVRCTSVSEVEAVTGIRDQVVIAKLLHDESGGGILVTKGPYNSVFSRRSNEGFSIDREISAATLLMSGLTPLKVVTPRGFALVCLDARRGTRLKIVGHQANSDDQYLVCEDVTRMQKLAREGGTAREKGKGVRLQLQLAKDLKWKRVLGIYDARNVLFV